MPNSSTSHPTTVLKSDHYCQILLPQSILGKGNEWTVECTWRDGWMDMGRVGKMSGKSGYHLRLLVRD